MSDDASSLTLEQRAALDRVLELTHERGDVEVALAESAPVDDAVAREARSLAAMLARVDRESFMSEPAALPETDSDDIPKRIDSFAIECVLGSGSSGTVYRAREQATGTPVALKVLDRVLAQADVRRRFRHEAELLNALDHPAIARVLKAGTHRDTGTPPAGLPYIAMELVENARPITTYADAHHLGIDERVALFADACDGIGHAHAHSIVHRDIKPANLLVGADGKVKVIDLGIARVLDPGAGTASMHTAQGRVVGTLQYMSPEQADGAVDVTDARSDVYALGAVLYELLCGQPPYDVGTMSIVSAARVIQEMPPIAPGAIDRRLRGDLERIVLTALNKDPTHRYADARELANELRLAIGATSDAGRRRRRAMITPRQVRDIVIAAVVLYVIIWIVSSLVNGTSHGPG